MEIAFVFIQKETLEKELKRRILHFQFILQVICGQGLGKRRFIIVRL